MIFCITQYPRTPVARPFARAGRHPATPLLPCCAAALAALPLLSGAARAQTTDAPALGAVEVREAHPTPQGKLQLDTPITTGSRLHLTARETPASVTVVDRATLEARGANNTQEALQAVPGVTAHDAPGSVGVSFRGFGSGSLGQMFNGINVQYSIAARPVDSWIYDRVEVIGGPSSFLFGSGAVGGSINYLTKLAERSDFAEGRARVGAYGLREVSVGVNRRLGGDTAPGATAHFARLDLNHREGGSWSEGTERRATQLAASVLSDLGTGLEHTLAYEYQSENVHRPYWGTPVLNPALGTLRIDEATRSKNYNSADGLYAQRVHWLRSLVQWRATDALQVRNTLYRYGALRDYRNVETYAFNASNTAVTRSGVLLQRHDHEVVGNRTDAQFQGQLGGRRSDSVVGLEFSVNRQTRFPNSLAGTVSTVHPYQFSTENFFDIPGMRPGFVPDRDNRVVTTALSLENRTALHPALHLVTALRHERIALDLTNRRAINAANPAHYARAYHPTTGRLGLVWDVVPGANLYAQYATAADPPAGILTTATFANARDNSALTTGRSIELGSKMDWWGGKGTATVAAFRITRSNIATQDPANTALTVLVGEQSSQGIELAVGLRPSARWQLQGNLTSTRARFERFVQGGVSLAGKTPTNTPETVANLWTSYALTPAITATAGVRHVGRVFANAANTQQWPSYTLLDLGVAWQLAPGTTLTGRVRNATDKVYAATVGSGQAYLGAPRSVDITLHTAF